MIKFFRRIRFDLMEQNKTGNPAFAAGRYFKYAIGEIVLVVVGILLALQINNWNEERKSSKKELVLLKSLKSEMIISLNGFNSDHKSSLKFYQSTKNIYQYIKFKPKLVDSMCLDFHRSTGFNYSFPKTSTYETLKSGDLEIIKSDSLRILITDIYESRYERVLRKVDTRRNAARLLFPYYQKHFRTVIVEKDSLSSSSQVLGIPNDYGFLINDPEYETLIVEALSGRYNMNRDLEKTIKKLENCIDQINKYLEELI